MHGKFLGLDIGTSSTKGVIVDEAGQILASTTRAHQVQRPHPGWVEMDGRIWWEEFQSIAAELLAAAGPVDAIGVSGMGPCTLLSDADGQPLRPAILYGVDTRASAEVAALSAEFSETELLGTYGSLLSSQAVGPKLAWLQAHEPEAWAKARYLFMPASYLVWQLTGEYTLDHHSASQCTPLYRLADEKWDDENWRRLAGGIERPRLGWAGQCAGLTREGLEGIAAGIPVTFGTIDAWTEAVGAGAAGSGDLMLMYGTTMFLIATDTAQMQHPAFWGTRGVYEGQWCLAGGMATSGAITDWLRRLSGRDFGELLEAAAQVGPGAGGLLLQPYFAGERTPISDPEARGAILGLTIEHEIGHLYRAALEGTALAVRHNLDVMRERGLQLQRVVAAGGGTTGDLWPQIVSDVTGQAQEIPSFTIGASYGCALLASGLVGEQADIRTWNPTARLIEPDPARHELYERLYQHYLQLYPATREISHDLARLQKELR